MRYSRDFLLSQYIPGKGLHSNLKDHTDWSSLHELVAVTTVECILQPSFVMSNSVEILPHEYSFYCFMRNDSYEVNALVIDVISGEFEYLEPFQHTQTKRTEISIIFGS